MKSKGVTVIELVTIIIAIGIILGIAIPSFRGLMSRRADQIALANIKMFFNAEKRYLTRYGVYFPVGAPVDTRKQTDRDLILEALNIDLYNMDPNWYYTINSPQPDRFTVTARREEDSLLGMTLHRIDEDGTITSSL